MLPNGTQLNPMLNLAVWCGASAKKKKNHAARRENLIALPCHVEILFKQLDRATWILHKVDTAVEGAGGSEIIASRQPRSG